MKTKVAQLAMLLLTLAFSVQARRKHLRYNPTCPAKTHLKVGQQAPDFTLTDTAGKPVKLRISKVRRTLYLHSMYSHSPGVERKS